MSETQTTRRRRGGGRPRMVAHRVVSPYHASHPRVTARIDLEMRERLNALLMREQQDFSHWLLDRIREQELARNPDSQGGVKKVIAEQFAQDVWELVQAKADEYYRLAQKVPKRTAEIEQKRELMEKYGKWSDYTAFLHGVLTQYQEVRAKLDSGLIKERHRPKAREYDEDGGDGGEVREWFGV